MSLIGKYSCRYTIAQIVIENWYLFDGKHYELVAFVVMPNHVHLLIRVFEGVSLSRILHGWKSYTAKVIKRHLKNAGEPPALPGKTSISSKIWQEDYWDRYIRDELHYFQAIEYIHNNPVKAALCNQSHVWPWSSAFPGSAGGSPASIADGNCGHPRSQGKQQAAYKLRE